MKALVVGLLLKIISIALWLGAITPTWFFLLISNPISAYFLYRGIRKVESNRLYSLSSFILDLALPAVGFISLVLFYGIGFAFRFINYHEEEEVYLAPYEASSFQDFEREKNFILQKNTKKKDILSAYDVEPLEWVLLGDYELPLKISAIEHLKRIGDSKAIKILKRGLKEDEYEVRYFSNGALEKIEKEKLQRIKDLSEQILENPEDITGYNDRGAAYLEIFRVELLDKSVERVFLEKALMDFMTSLSLNPKQSYLYTRIIEVNLLLKNYTELISLGDYALASAISQEDKAKIYFYLAEAHYIKGNIDKVRECCEKSAQYRTNYPLIDSCLDWWLHAS